LVGLVPVREVVPTLGGENNITDKVSVVLIDWEFEGQALLIDEEVTHARFTGDLNTSTDQTLDVIEGCDLNGLRRKVGWVERHFHFILLWE
jgi:hypothetical protein